MICLLALLVFAILGIFSASHRKLAKEAFDCVFRKMTLRRCQTGLDQRLRANVSGTLLKRHKKLGKFVYSHFNVISWIFTILFVWSIIQAGIGGYNFYLYGNCNGPDADGFCIFDPTGEYQGFTEQEEGCSDPTLLNQYLMNDIDKMVYTSLSDGSEDVYFLGCYACEYTRKAYPVIQKLAEKEDVVLQFAHFSVKSHNPDIDLMAQCAADQDMLGQFNELMFSIPVEELHDENLVERVATTLSFSTLTACVADPATLEKANYRREEILKTGIYGTPLVFIGEEIFVGPKPYRIYKRALP